MSSHEIIVLPTRALRKGDEDYAVVFAIPADTKGLIHIVGRNSLDTRELEGVDRGNIRHSKYCPTLIFNDVFVPWERVFMCGEVEFAGEIVRRFLAFHRQSHGGCKAGKIDAMTGAAQLMAEYNGTSRVGHIRKKEPSGTYFIDPVLANASKIYEGKEMSRRGGFWWMWLVDMWPTCLPIRIWKILKSVP